MNVLQKVTLQSLKQNCSRTWITIIGIILSTAMITAVSTIGASFYDFLYRQTASRYGKWSLACQIPEDLQAELKQESAIDDIAYVQEMGYALQGMCTPAAYRPYTFVLGVDETAQSLLPLQLTAGRYPENQNEVMISADLASMGSEGNYLYKLNGSITLDLGTRAQDGQPMYFFDLNSDKETFTPTHTKEYQIVGIYENDLSFLAAKSVGNAIITVPDSHTDFPQWTFLHLKSPRTLQQLAKEPVPGVYLNQNILFAHGFLPGGLGNALRSILILVILLIMGASIAMIYNAFSISVSERTKQFGLLSSIGTTHRQQRSMVRYEALLVSAIGIPLGILSGLVGIGITLHFIEPAFMQAMGEGTSEPLRLIISPLALAASAVIALLTVLLSARIPARRACRISALQAIRQEEDISLTVKDVHVGQHGRHPFGFPGILADKYYRRSHKKYRSTIFSLVTSIILFVAAWSMTDYITFLADTAYPKNLPDLTYYVGNAVVPEAILSQIQAIPTVEDAMVQTAQLCHEATDENGQAYEVWVNFVSEDAWTKLLQENHLDQKLFNDPAAPLAVAVDGKVTHTPGEETFVVNDLIPGNSLETTCRVLSGETKILRAGAVLEQVPFFVELGDLERPAYALIYPLRFLELLDIDASPAQQIQIRAQDPKFVEGQLREHAYRNGIPTWGLHNHAEYISSMQNMVLLAQVFFGGFLALLTLIAVANIFNTISTNLSLRRRDFAMLKTVGMSRKDIHHMLQYECVLYGTRALLYGIPLAVLFSVLIDWVIGAGIKLGFRLPWPALIIATISVFIIVGISMAYAVYKLEQNSLLDTLKNENL